MFCINVWLTVKESDNVSVVRELLLQAATLSRTEPGCVRFEVYHSEADTNRFLLCEHWETRSHWEAHRNEKAFSEIYQPKVLPLVDREPHISQLVE